MSENILTLPIIVSIMCGSVQFKYVMKCIKNNDAKKKRDEKKALTKEKKEKELSERKEAREAGMMVNLKLSDGSVVSVACALADTVGSFREAVAKKIKMSKGKARATLTLYFGEINITDAPRASLGKFGLYDGCVVRVKFQGSGGGKGIIKKMALLKKRCTTATNDKDFEAFKYAFECAKTAGAITSVNITEMVRTMPTPLQEVF